MNKYIKLDDVIHNINLEVIGRKEYTGDMKANLFFALDDLPTIEVSEDCISKHDIWKIIEDNAYWVRYNENSTEKGMTLTGINQALNECPPVIPTVSEDYISRAYAIEVLSHVKKDEQWRTECIDNEIRLIKLLPSVVPSRAEGEWVLSDIQRQEDNDNGNYAYVCTNCNHTDIHAKTQEVPYCWWCGAKMK